MKSGTTLEYFQKFYDQSYNTAIEYILVKTGDVSFSKKVIVDCYREILKSIRANNENDDNALSALLYQSLDKNIAAYWKDRRSFAPFSREMLVNQNLDEKHIREELLTPLSESVSEISYEQLSQIVLKCLDTQQPLQRRAFILYIFFQNNVEECAKKLDITPTTAALYIKDTLQHISHALTDHSLAE